MLQKCLTGTLSDVCRNESNDYNKTFCFFQSENQPLQQVTVQIISDSSCNSTYDYRGGITDRMICAGDPNGGKGECLVIGSQ
jgi:hypothetical protein